MRREVITGLLILIAITAIAQKKQFTSLSEALYSESALRGDPGPSGVHWFDDGARYSFTRNDQGSQQIWIYDIEEGSEELVFSGGDFDFPGTGQQFRYRSFQWTRDYQYLLFQCNFQPIWRYSGNADYYYYSLKEKSMKPVVEGAFTAEVSPDGSKVGYGKEGDLYLFDLASGRHTQLTRDGADKYYNGRFGWANEEEFGLVQAWEWSYDSRYIAFWQTDEREVPVYMLTDFSGQHPEYMEIPYPKVGDDPPVERLGILDIQNGTKKWLDLDPEGGYMPRIYWTSMPNTLVVVWLSREHNHLKLYRFDVLTGEKNVILEERSETWIDIFDFFAGEDHLFYFPANTDSFFWISDRDGYSHIYHYDLEGNLLERSTEGEYDVIGIKAIDTEKKLLYYLSCEVSPLERNLFIVRFNGKGKKRITAEPGNHSVDLSPSGAYFIDTYSDVNTPSTTDLKDGRGRFVKNLAGHDRADAFLAEYDYSGRELFSFTTSDGQPIDGYLIKPMDFDPDRSYPLLMDVYGGAGSQEVYNSFENSGWLQYLAQQGYVVANINNRGNGGYGRDFEKTVYGKVGIQEASDFAEAARFLSGKSWIDGNRVGIMGHSYGGFSSGMSLLLHPDVFHAAIVTAAVTDRRNYDCIFTERYMGLVDKNREGYDRSAMVNYAGELQGKLLLVHSLLDDNVHPQNTFQMVTALINQGKQFDLKIFPSGNHRVRYDGQSTIYLYREYFDWLEENLKGKEVD